MMTKEQMAKAIAAKKADPSMGRPKLIAWPMTATISAGLVRVARPPQ